MGEPEYCYKCQKNVLLCVCDEPILSEGDWQRWAQAEIKKYKPFYEAIVTFTLSDKLPPREQLQAIINWYTQVAIDPAVNGGFRLFKKPPVHTIIEFGCWYCRLSAWINHKLGRCWSCCAYCEAEADLVINDEVVDVTSEMSGDTREHHIACCYQVTGGLEPCDCPLSTDGGV